MMFNLLLRRRVCVLKTHNSSNNAGTKVEICMSCRARKRALYQNTCASKLDCEKGDFFRVLTAYPWFTMMTDFCFQ